MKSVYDGYRSFADDEEKMHDFMVLSMEEFLESYSYLDVEDYYATYDEVMSTPILKGLNGSACFGCAYSKACFDDERIVPCNGYMFDGKNPESYDALSVWGKVNCIDQFVNVMNPYMDDEDVNDVKDIEYEIKQWIGDQYYIDELGNWYDEGRKVRD